MSDSTEQIRKGWREYQRGELRPVEEFMAELEEELKMTKPHLHLIERMSGASAITKCGLYSIPSRTTKDRTEVTCTLCLNRSKDEKVEDAETSEPERVS
jgi:hypothetical protein